MTISCVDIQRQENPSSLEPECPWKHENASFLEPDWRWKHENWSSQGPERLEWPAGWVAMDMLWTLGMAEE